MRKSLILLIAFVLVIFSAVPSPAGTMELFADKLVYNPDDGTITAEGNVNVKGEDMFAEAVKGKASADGNRVELQEKVRVRTIKDPMLIECAKAQSVLTKDGREVTCWEVQRFVHETRGVTMRAEKIVGLLKDGAFENIKATGNVKAQMKDKNKKTVTVTSDSAYYDSKRGTVLFQGKAFAVTEDRTVEAEKFTYYLADGKIKAEGSTKTVFILKDQEKE